MTGAATMTEFTPPAEARLAAYLRDVRSAAARAPGVSPDEIEADIREHVGAEFASAAGPVGLVELDAVLARLGPPAHWVPSAAGPAPVVPGRSLGELFREARRRLADVLWRGPEDWRLPYLAFGVFALGVLAFPLFPLFLLVSYILARAGMAAAAEKGVALGARRWLVYPPVVIVSLAVVLKMLLWPVVAVGAATADEFERAARRVSQRDATGEARDQYGRLTPEDPFEKLTRAVPLPPKAAGFVLMVFAMAGATAAWWIVLGGVGMAYPGAVRAAVPPFADGWEARHGRRLFTAGVLGALVWAGFAYRLADAAGAFS